MSDYTVVSIRVLDSNLELKDNNMDYFGYEQVPQVPQDPPPLPDRYQVERDELQQVMAALRRRYGRRRLFRVADVAEVVRALRRDRDFQSPGPATPPRRETPRTVRRLRVDLYED